MAMKMVKSMGTSLMSLLFGLSLAVNSASADYVIKDGNGTTQTVKAFACTAVAGGTAICPGYTPQDLSGNALGVPGNPFAISFGTGVQLPGFASPPAVNLQDGSGNAIGSTSGSLNVNCSNCSGGGAGGSVNLTQINGASPSLTNPLWVSPATGASFAVTGSFWPYTLGQQVAGSSVPVVLTAAQLATLTPPTSVGITGMLPAFADTPTVNLGTLNGAATAANQSSQLTQETASAAAAGTTSDTAYSGSGSSSIIAALKGLYAKLAGTLSIQGTAGGTAVPSVQIGTANLATAQASVGATATQIVAARTGAQGTGRKTVCVTQAGSTVVYLGGSGVTTSSGDYLAGTPGAGKCFDTQAAIYGIVASGTDAVSATETY